LTSIHPVWQARHVRRRFLIGLVALALAGAGAPSAAADAQNHAPAKAQTQSLDSEAPKGAPPHWLPNERWVMQHWLPYDEARLYDLLDADRGDVWRWLRDDTRSLADLARERGKDPAEVAAALVRPWRGKLREPHRLKVLERRALRTLTQGHLAQHVFFHSLHQNAIPDRAPAIFGVASREEFQELRRSELSPVQICRLNGLPRSHAQREAVRTLKAEVRAGVKGQAIPPAQAERLLRRQLRQVPRWLQQTRYNGPPPLKLPRASLATASNYSNNAAIAADGSSVAYESYEAGLAGAKVRGEIGVVAASVDGAGKPLGVSSPEASGRRSPRSAYNPSVSADGRFVAFESAEGNLNFAKRYGQMQVFVRDTRSGKSVLASKSALDLGATEARPVPRSAYNPSLSDDGRIVAYESSEAGRGRLDVYVRDLRASTARRVPPPPGAKAISEPALSGDGGSLAFSALDAAGRSAVYVRTLATGTTRRVSPAGEEAFEPDVARDGRTVAYTVLGDDRRTRVERRVLSAPRAVTLAPRPGDGLAAGTSAAEPSLSADGKRVAFTARIARERRSRVFVTDPASPVPILASRADGLAGLSGTGSSAHPSLSADGGRVAFTSDAHDLAPAKCNGARGIFVRDLRAASTVLISRRDGANRYSGPTKGSSTDRDMLLTLTCPASASASASGV
jgi:Tol biopolymer transport system component